MCTAVNPESPLSEGVHHVGLSVSDVQQTRDFFVAVLGYREVGGKPDYPAIFVSDGVTLLTLWQVDSHEKVADFNRRKNIGLHHLALKLKARTDLAALYVKLQSERGVSIEFPPEPLGTSGLEHMMCTIPGGVRMELIALPAG